MKRILILLLGVCFYFSASAQIPADTATLRNRINTQVVPNGAKQITATQMNEILNGLLNTAAHSIQEAIDFNPNISHNSSIILNNALTFTTDGTKLNNYFTLSRGVSTLGLTYLSSYLYSAPVNFQTFITANNNSVSMGTVDTSMNLKNSIYFTNSQGSGIALNGIIRGTGGQFNISYNSAFSDVLDFYNELGTKTVSFFPTTQNKIALNLSGKLTLSDSLFLAVAGSDASSDTTLTKPLVRVNSSHYIKTSNWNNLAQGLLSTGLFSSGTTINNGEGTVWNSGTSAVDLGGIFTTSRYIDAQHNGLEINNLSYLTFDLPSGASMDLIDSINGFYASTFGYSTGIETDYKDLLGNFIGASLFDVNNSIIFANGGDIQFSSSGIAIEGDQVNINSNTGYYHFGSSLPSYFSALDTTLVQPFIVENNNGATGRMHLTDWKSYAQGLLSTGLFGAGSTINNGEGTVWNTITSAVDLGGLFTSNRYIDAQHNGLEINNLSYLTYDLPSGATLDLNDSINKFGISLYMQNGGAEIDFNSLSNGNYGYFQMDSAYGILGWQDISGGNHGGFISFAVPNGLATQGLNLITQDGIQLASYSGRYYFYWGGGSPGLPEYATSDSTIQQPFVVDNTNGEMHLTDWKSYAQAINATGVISINNGQATVWDSTTHAVDLGGALSNDVTIAGNNFSMKFDSLASLTFEVPGQVTFSDSSHNAVMQMSANNNNEYDIFFGSSNFITTYAGIKASFKGLEIGGLYSPGAGIGAPVPYISLGTGWSRDVYPTKGGFFMSPNYIELVSDSGITFNNANIGGYNIDIALRPQLRTLTADIWLPYTQNASDTLATLYDVRKSITNYVAKATSYTASSSDKTIEVTASGQTITLPTAVGKVGKVYTVKLTSATSTGTVATTSSQTIDGSTTYTLSAQYKYVTVQSNGANWLIIGNN